MHKNNHQLTPPKRKRRGVSGVSFPPNVLPYYFLWYGGTSLMAPYGGPGGANETAQNDFGKESYGSGTGTGEAGGDGGGGSGSV